MMPLSSWLVRWSQTLAIGRVSAGPSHLICRSSTSPVCSKGLRSVSGQGITVPFNLFGARTVSIRASTFDNTALEVKEDHLLMRNGEWGSVKIPFYWLRHNCRCPTCFHAETSQVLFNITDLDLDTKISDVLSESHDVTITFSDGHRSVFSHAWLREHAPGVANLSQNEKVTFKTLWQGSHFKMPSFNFSDIRNDNSTLKNLLQTIHEYGVAVIDGVKPSEEYHAIVGKFVIGGLQSTFFSSEVCKTSPGLEEADLSYTNVGIPLHTDTSYFSSPVRGMTLQIIERSGEGGQTIVSDGFYALERLRSNNPEYFRILCDTDLLIHYIDDTRDIKSSGPTITISSSTKQIERICFNPTRTTIKNVPFELMLDFYRAYQTLAKEIYHEENAFKILLKPDQLMIYDNWRVLHARESFTGHRVLLTAYLRHDDWMSQMRKICGLDV